jgi:hypothetical protein
MTKENCFKRREKYWYNGMAKVTKIDMFNLRPFSVNWTGQKRNVSHPVRNSVFWFESLPYVHVRMVQKVFVFYIGMWATTGCNISLTAEWCYVFPPAWKPKNRMTRLGELSPIGGLYTFGQFFWKLQKVAQVSGLLFQRLRLCINFDKKLGLG